MHPSAEKGMSAPRYGLASTLPRVPGVLGIRKLVFALAILSALYARPIFGLGHLIASHDLYTYIPLIPLVTIYLIWLKRNNLALAQPAKSRRVVAFVPATAGTLALLL